MASLKAFEVSLHEVSLSFQPRRAHRFEPNVHGDKDYQMTSLEALSNTNLKSRCEVALPPAVDAYWQLPM